MQKRVVVQDYAAPKCSGLLPAHTILSHGVESVNSLAELYRTLRKGKGGAPTHEQQDVLRAMLVMAGAALDATLKRLFRDSFTSVLEHSRPAQQMAARYLKRTVLDDGNEGKTILATALLSMDARSTLLQSIVEDLTRASQQSVDQVRRLCSFLGVDDPFKVREGKWEDVGCAFEERNRIVHEMDAVLEGKTKRGGRKRLQRRQQAMYGHARTLLDLADAIMRCVDMMLIPCEE